MHPNAHSPRPLRSERRASQAAFTLIELLTVIAIIGILAAIILPVVGKVRQTARWAQGSSNIRQVTMGMIMMAEENRGRLLLWNEPKPNGGSGVWGHHLTQFLNSGDRNVSPAQNHPSLMDPLVNVTAAGGAPFHFAAPDMQCPDKSREAQMAGGGVFAAYARFRNIRGYTAPSQQIYFVDAGVNEDGAGAHGNLTGGDMLIWNVVAWSAATADNPIAAGTGLPGHIRWTEGKAKFGFMDGHVKILKQGEVKRRNLNPLL